MKLALRAAVAAIALCAAMPAAASITYDPNTGLVTVDGNTTIGDSVTVAFNGYEPNNPPILGLTSELTLIFQGVSGNSYLFDYLLANTSTSVIDAARITAFGFGDVTPNALLVGSSVNGAYTTISSGNFPGGTDLEFCAKNGQDNNCAGSQGGPDIGQSGSGDLIIGFSGLNSSITLGGLSVRYQGIISEELGIRDGSAIGSPTTPAVPEPATWAMMIVGFGAAGYAIRRRRRRLIPQAA